MVLENYADMNLDELGSSLLQKKSERERQAAKRARKNERVQKALALLLMGQGIMKSQYSKRAKELEELHKFELLNNESQARDYMINSRLISPMAEWAEETKDLGGNVEDRLKSFKNSDQYIRFENNVRPVLEKNVQEALFKDDYESMYGTPELYNGISSGVDDYARHFLENNRYKTYEDELRQVLNEKDLDAKKLFDLSQGLTKHDVDKYEKATYKKLLNDARAEANIVSGLKKVLNKFGANFKDSGGFDLFQKVDENILAGPTVKDVSQAINLRGITLRVTDNILETVRKTPERFASQINLPQNTNLKKKIADFENGPLSSFKNLIEEKKYPSELGTSTFINDKNIDNMLDHLEENVAQKNSFVESVGALNLRLLKDKNFVRDVYDKTEGSKDDGKSFVDFQKILSNETNRIHFATMLVMNAGFEPEKTFTSQALTALKYVPMTAATARVSEFFNPNAFTPREYRSFGTLDKVYNNFKVASAIGEGVNVTDKVEVSDSFVNASKEQKQKMLEDEAERIIADPVLDNTRKQVMLSQLSPVIQQVTKMSSSDFFENLAEKRNKINVKSPIQAGAEFGQMAGDRRSVNEGIGSVPQTSGQMGRRKNINIKSPIQAGTEVGANIADTAKGIVDRFNRARTSAVDAGAQAGANVRGALRQTGEAFGESGADLRESSKELLDDISSTIERGKDAFLNLFQKEENSDVKQKIKTTQDSLKNVTDANAKKIVNNKVIPINIRHFVYDLFGGDKKITEKDLSTEEINTLKNLITPEILSKNTIEYEDYETGTTYGDVGLSRDTNPLTQSFKDNKYALKTFLGQASVRLNNKKELIVKDAYDFNDADDKVTFDSFMADMKVILGNPLYLGPRKIAKYFGSAPGEGSPIEINLGKIT